MTVAALHLPPRRRLPSRIEEAMRTARTCYDHLAGRLGVGLADALPARGQIVLGEDGGEVTPAGMRFLADFGVVLPTGTGSRRPFCRPCLDWSERRWHVAGAVGAALCRRCLELGWIERASATRAVSITDAGRRGFAESFGLDWRGQGESHAAA
jgi:hypothetical protein